jgi:hypothetical protein
LTLVRATPYIVEKSTWPAPPARALDHATSVGNDFKRSHRMKKKAKKEDKKAPKKGK